MSWKQKKYEETLNTLVSFWEEKVIADPEGTLILVNQELSSQDVRFGNDWTGRGALMDTVISATISSLEITRASCLNRLNDPQRKK